MASSRFEYKAFLVGHSCYSMTYVALPICDQLPAGRTPSGKIGRERGSRRPGGGRRHLHPPVLSTDAARQPPAATVGQRVNVQCDRLAEPHREIRVVLHRVLGQRVDEDIEPVAVHHQVGHHLLEPDSIGFSGRQMGVIS